MIDQLRQLEDVKSLAGARQAETAVAFDVSQRRVQAAAGVPAEEQGAGVAAQIALARRESPAKGGRLLGLAKALTGTPRTFAAFRSGRLNEWRTTLVVKETACLTVEDRAAVDEELAADTGALDGAGDRAIINAVRTAAYRRDPRSVARRAAHAVTERRVSLRPAPDAMTYLTALLPAAQGVPAYAALVREADAARSGADERSRGQVMADTLVERVTGTAGGITGIDLQVVMTDRSLFQGDSEPARIPVTASCPPKPPAPSSSTPNVPVPKPMTGRTWHSGSAGSTPPPGQASSWRWTPGAGSSRPGSDGFFRSGTTPAGRRTATRRSATTTTFSPGTTAELPAQATAKGFAKPATTPRKPPAGRQNHSGCPASGTPSKPVPHRPHLPLHRTAAAGHSAEQGLGFRPGA